MPIVAEKVLPFKDFNSLATLTAIQSIDASGTVSEKEWFKKQ